MKNRALMVAVVVIMGLSLSACQSMSPFFASGNIAPQDRIALDQSQESGTWQGQDITVDYRLARKEHDMDVSGTARFNDNMSRNFQILRDFHLSVIFADKDGRVLGSQGLATNRGNFEPTQFHARLVPPPGTADISFGYQGTALTVGDDEGGGGTTSFWQYPVH